MSKKILAIIGLRSGSKGVKDKNIKNLGGKPLAAWIINAAKKSIYINRIIVSTDSKIYAKIANKYGAETPFLRPKKISGDNSDELDFIKDMLKKLKNNNGYQPDIIVRLLATCPFQKSKDIDKAIKIVLNKDYESSVIVSESKQHPEKALKIINSKKKSIVNFINNDWKSVGGKLNRQRFKKAYFRSNAIITKTENIKKNSSLAAKKTGFIIIPKSIDIDDKYDFEFAKYMLKKKIN